jgi:hypothetical protein
MGVQALQIEHQSHFGSPEQSDTKMLYTLKAYAILTVTARRLISELVPLHTATWLYMAINNDYQRS